MPDKILLYKRNMYIYIKYIKDISNKNRPIYLSSL